MGGLSKALWFWIPVLIYKAISAFLRTIWKLNLWILQTVSGVPLYYCKPEYRIPGIFLGTIGVLSIFNFLLFLMFLGSEKGISQGGTSATGEMILMGLIGAGLLLFCRFLIRRGSI
jgi:hypothetical protein